MTTLLRRLQRSDWPEITMDQWVSMFTFQGNEYPLGIGQQTLTGTREQIAQSYAGYCGVFKGNAIVFACMVRRMMLFSEARLQYRRRINGRPGDLFGDSTLGIVERPWRNGTTADLLARMIQGADLSGNFYANRQGNQLFRMRPDWTTIILGSHEEPDDPDEDDGWALDAEVIGYAYQEGGPSRGKTPLILMPENVVHWAPIPDPDARFRGMSWLMPVIREVLGDNAATEHKLKFFENGATPNMVVSTELDLTTDAFKDWVDAMENQTEGLLNAYRTLYLAKGGTANVVGANLRQIDFKTTQGAGETRIAAAAGVPPVVAGFSEGLAAATYSNYAQARRAFADGTMRPLWRGAAASLETVVPPPGGAELWYDDRDIPFLQEDQKDAVEILAGEATTIHTLISAGYQPDSVVDAVTSGDLSRLVHTGLYSVQLQPAGTVSEGKGSVVQGATEPAAGQQAP